jgi:hypothetical protein
MVEIPSVARATSGQALRCAQDGGVGDARPSIDGEFGRHRALTTHPNAGTEHGGAITEVTEKQILTAVRQG